MAARWGLAGRGAIAMGKGLIPWRVRGEQSGYSASDLVTSDSLLKNWQNLWAEMYHEGNMQKSACDR